MKITLVDTATFVKWTLQKWFLMVDILIEKWSRVDSGDLKKSSMSDLEMVSGLNCILEGLPTDEQLSQQRQ